MGHSIWKTGRNGEATEKCYIKEMKKREGQSKDPRKSAQHQQEIKLC